MTIKTGEVANADEVMNAFGLIFSDHANLIWNADLIGFDGDLEQEWNQVFWDTIQVNTDIDSTSEIKDVPIIGGEIMDDFEDGSIDANIWTTADNSTGSGSGTISESVGRIILSGSVPDSPVGSAVITATADQVNSIDFRNGDNTSTMWLDMLGSVTNGGIFHVYLTDGTTDIDLMSTNAISRGVYRFEINPGTNNVESYTVANDFNGAGASSSISVSTLENAIPWRLEFKVSFSQAGGGTRTASLSCYNVKYLLNTVADTDFISATETAGSTITNAILAKSDDVANGSIDYFLSADNGSNYEAVDPNEIHRFTDTGTQLKVKATLNTTVDKIPQLYHYAVKYGLY